MHVAIGYNWFVTAVGFHLERALRQLGHTVTYVGLPSPQRAGYDSRVALPELISALPQQPDVYLWVDPAGPYFPLGIEAVPLPTACYLVDVHLGQWRQEVARFFDVVLVAQKDYVPCYRQAVGHEQVYWLPLAAAPDVHCQWDLPRIYDVAFVGNLARAHRHTPRARRLRLLAERFRTNDFSRFYPPEEVGQVYSQARIVFDTSIAGDVTMRVFEGTACGAMVLTDTAANGLDELFDLGREVVTYGGDAELLDKMAHYLDHEEERRAIAQRGQRRTLERHTYVHRMATALRLIADPETRMLAPLRQATVRERLAARRQVYTHLHMLDNLLDDLRAADHGPLMRLWLAGSCLLRRLLL